MSEDQVVLGLCSLVVLGVGAQWIGRRLAFPSLLLLLPAGLVAGATGLVEPDELLGGSLFPLVTLLVALLLFQSGLDLRLADLPRPARGPVVRLVTFGLLITFVLGSAVLVLLTDLPNDVALVAGALLVVSGPTVVGPLLAVIRPHARARSVLAWEGTVLDPLGATLGVVVLNLVLAADRGGLHPAMQLFGRLGIGVAIGAVAAAVLVFVISRYLVTDDMEAAVAVLVAVAAFGAAELVLSEAGLFAAVTLGVVAANQRIAPTARIAGFGETLEVLIIGVLFILLGALVPVEDLGTVALPTAGVVVLLVLVVRPTAVWASLLGTGLSRNEQGLIAWMAPRGVVAAATAAQFSGTLSSAGLEASLLVPIVFGVILGTGAVYGLSARPVARALGVVEPSPTGVALVGAEPWVLDLARALQGLGVDVLVVTAQSPAELAERHLTIPMLSVLESEAELTEALAEAPLARAVVIGEPGAMVTLVVAELVEQVGRRHVFRLPHRDESTVERIVAEAWSPQPFTEDANLCELRHRVDAGAEVVVCEGDLPAGAVPLAAVRDDGYVDLQPGMAQRSVGSPLVALVGGDSSEPA